MIIHFSPQNINSKLSIEVTSAHIIRVNEDLFNFNDMNDGDIIQAENVPCEWIVETVKRIDGETHITLILPYGDLIEEDLHILFPEPIEVNENGPVNIPFATWKEIKEEEVEGGKNIISITHFWGKDSEINVEFKENKQELGQKDLELEKEES